VISGVAVRTLFRDANHMAVVADWNYEHCIVMTELSLLARNVDLSGAKVWHDARQNHLRENSDGADGDICSSSTKVCGWLC
jgi:hypothetical protein